VPCIDVAQDRDQWWISRNAVMKFVFREIDYLSDHFLKNYCLYWRWFSCWMKSPYRLKESSCSISHSHDVLQPGRTFYAVIRTTEGQFRDIRISASALCTGKGVLLSILTIVEWLRTYNLWRFRIDQGSPNWYLWGPFHTLDPMSIEAWVTQSVLGRTTGWTARVRFTTGSRDFSLHTVQNGYGPPSFQRLKRPGSEADHSTPSSAKVKNGGGIPPLLIGLHGVVLN
jgi:hypothetical protein